ncbi:MAG: hypothetical protein ACLFRG_05980 [Desulfococcaceae bacterium]
MDTAAYPHFDELIHIAEKAFQDVLCHLDTTPKRALLTLRGKYEFCEIFVTELRAGRERKYRFYAIREGTVAAGFDNAPDPRALRMKFGKINPKNIGTPIPHLHLDNKTRLVLTEEITLSDFVQWLRENPVCDE